MISPWYIRRRRALGGVPLAVSNYFAQAPITDSNQKSAVLTAYRGLVASNQIASMKQWYPCMGATLSASLMDFITLTRATTPGDAPTYDITTGWIFNGTGMGTTEYINTGFTPSVNGGTLWTDDTGYLSTDILFIDGTTGTFAGAQGGGKESYLRFDAGITGIYGAINVAAVAPYQQCGFFPGTYSVLRYQTAITHVFYNGFEVLEDTTAASLAPSNRPIFIGAMNDVTLGATDLLAGYICGARIGGHVDPSVIDPIISTMNQAVGRNLF